MVPRGVCPYGPSGGASGDEASNGDAICLTSFVVIHPRLRQQVSMFEARVCGHHQSMAPRRCLTRLSEPRGGYTGDVQRKHRGHMLACSRGLARSPCAAEKPEVGHTAPALMIQSNARRLGSESLAGSSVIVNSQLPPRVKPQLRAQMPTNLTCGGQIPLQHLRDCSGTSQPCESLKSPWQVRLPPSSVNHRNQHMCRSDPLCQQPSTILSHACLVGDQESRLRTRELG